MGEARELMDRLTEETLGGNLDALRDIYAPDCVATTPDAGTLNGVDAVIEWNRTYLEAFSDLRYESMQKFETAECAVDQGELIGTHTGTLKSPDGQNIPPTGKQVRTRSADIATVRNGKIVRHDFYYDQLDFLSQLGLMQAQAASTTTPRS
jgi:ketosteroid isomerase-like protein